MSDSISSDSKNSDNLQEETVLRLSDLLEHHTTVDPNSGYTIQRVFNKDTIDEFVEDLKKKLFYSLTLDWKNSKLLPYAHDVGLYGDGRVFEIPSVVTFILVRQKHQIANEDVTQAHSLQGQQSRCS